MNYNIPSAMSAWGSLSGARPEQGVIEDIICRINSLHLLASDIETGVRLAADKLFGSDVDPRKDYAESTSDVRPGVQRIHDALDDLRRTLLCARENRARLDRL